MSHYPEQDEQRAWISGHSPQGQGKSFLEGIRNSGFESASIAIKDDPTMREDFEAAQARICEFKSLLDSRLPKSQCGVVAMYGGGRSGGGGNGHG